MRRPGRSTTVSVGLAASLVLALLVGSSMLPAAGRPTKPEANRFAPSGVVGVDPDAAAIAGGAAFLGRGQGQHETGVAVSPKNSRHLLVGQNDYRRGPSATTATMSG